MHLTTPNRLPKGALPDGDRVRAAVVPRVSTARELDVLFAGERLGASGRLHAGRWFARGQTGGLCTGEWRLLVHCSPRRRLFYHEGAPLPIHILCILHFSYCR